MRTEKSPSGPWGVMASFDSPGQLLSAIARAKQAGYKDMEAYTPYPNEEVIEALGHHHSKVPLLTLVAALAGGCGGFALASWVSMQAYPMNIGGRPLMSWVAFIPVTFETTVLAAGLTAAIGMILLNGLPEPYHPVFNAPGFERASQDRFFLCIEATDPRFDSKEARSFLSTLHPIEVVDVAP